MMAITVSDITDLTNLTADLWETIPPSFIQKKLQPWLKQKPCGFYQINVTVFVSLSFFLVTWSTHLHPLKLT